MTILEEILRKLNASKYKVFVSYHHANNQWDREQFESLFSDYYDIMISESVQIGDIDSNLKTDTIRQKIRDEYLRDSTVTQVVPLWVDIYINNSQCQG